MSPRPPSPQSLARARRRKAAASAHGTRIKAVYGLTRAEYDQLLAAQNGRCAICAGKRSYRLNVDHNHATGEVRGLLCRLCNGRLLPAAHDSSVTLRLAATYLERPPVRAVLGQRFVPVGAAPVRQTTDPDAFRADL